MVEASAPSPFSPSLPTFQVSWDSTSLGWLKTCPRLYQFEMLLGYEPKARSLHLEFGGLYASSLERYHHARAKGESHDAATLAMVRYALVASVSFDPGDHKYAPYKNRYTLLRSLVWNVEDLLTSPWETVILQSGKPAVELSFNFHAFDLDGEAISLSGHMDRVVTADSQYWVQDDKTTKNAIDANYFAQYTPNNQMSLYTAAGSVVLSLPIRGVLVRATQILVSGNRFTTQQVPRPKAVVDEWLADAKTYITQAKFYAKANHWPANDKSCFLCEFKKVCAVSPAHREQWLAADFMKRKPWNPLESRGDI